MRFEDALDRKAYVKSVRESFGARQGQADIARAKR